MPSRGDGPSKEEWEQKREKIIDLFLNQKKTIPKLQEQMEKEGFKASKRMYLARLGDWKAFKHNKAPEKDQLLSRILEDCRNGREPPPLTPNQFRKLQRHYKEKARAGAPDPAIESLLRKMQGSSSISTGSIGSQKDKLPSAGNNSEVESSESNSSDSSSMSTSSTSSEQESNLNLIMSPDSLEENPSRSAPSFDISKYWLPTSGKSAELEEVLILSRDYYTATISKHLHSDARWDTGIDASSFMSNRDPNSSLAANKALWTTIKSAIYFYKEKIKDSRSLTLPLLLAPNVAALCKQEPFTLLKDLFATLSPVNMSLCPGYRLALLENFAESSATVLGHGHPLPVICDRLRKDANAPEISMTGLVLIHRISEKKLPSEHCEMFEIKRTLVRLLRRQDDLSDAKRLSVSLIKASEESKGKNNVQTLLAMSELVYILNKEKRYSESKAFAERIVHRYRRTQGDKPANERFIYAMEDLAEVCDRLDQLKESMYWLRKALNAAVILWKNREATIHISEKVDDLYDRIARS